MSTTTRSRMVSPKEQRTTAASGTGSASEQPAMTAIPRTTDQESGEERVRQHDRAQQHCRPHIQKAVSIRHNLVRRAIGSCTRPTRMRVPGATRTRNGPRSGRGGFRLVAKAPLTALQAWRSRIASLFRMA
jgi:hypothetical protein